MVADGAWSSEEVEQRVAEVREVLLGFLRDRTRLDWFRHKVRWRLSRRYVWPGATDGLASLLDEAVARDVGVEALTAHVEQRSAEITRAIERYNHALRRHIEERERCRVNELGDAALRELRERRITFPGIRDELHRRGRSLDAQSGPDLVPELLSLRLAILDEDARTQVFREVSALLATEQADREPEMLPEEREALAIAIERRLRVLDRYHAAHLLADSYNEARRMLCVDHDIAELQATAGAEIASPGTDPGRAQRLQLVRELVARELAFLEALYPKTEGTHTREMKLLRAPADAPLDAGD